MKLRALHVLPDSAGTARVSAAVRQLQRETESGAEVWAITQPSPLDGVGPQVTVLPIDPELAPPPVDASSARGTLNVLALLKSLELDSQPADVVVVHGDYALPAARAIADRWGRPLVVLDGAAGTPVEIVEPPAGSAPVPVAARLNHYRALLEGTTPAPSAGQTTRPALVVLGDGLDWGCVEPLLLELEDVQVLKGDGPAVRSRALAASVAVLAGTRDDAPELVLALLNAAVLPIVVGATAPRLAGLERGGCLRRVTSDALLPEAKRWVADSAARAAFLSRARPDAHGDREPPRLTATTTGTTSADTPTVRFEAPVSIRPLRVVLNHGGLVAQELATSLSVLGWELSPLLGPGRDPLSGADLLIALPYGDPGGALSAVRRARRLGVPAVFWNVEDPRYFLDDRLGPVVRQLAAESTLSFSSTLQLEDAYRELGVELHYLPVYGRGYFDLAAPVPERERTVDLLFLGTLTEERRLFLSQLQARLGDELTLEARDDVRDPDAARDLVSRARLALSQGTLTDTPAARGQGVTERVFDYPLAGTAVLSDERAHLAGLFTPGEDVFVFQDVDDAADQARALIRDPGRRAQAAARARRKVLNAHLGRHRIATVVQRLAEQGALASAQARAAAARALECLAQERVEQGDPS